MKITKEGRNGNDKEEDLPYDIPHLFLLVVGHLSAGGAKGVIDAWPKIRKYYAWLVLDP